MKCGEETPGQITCQVTCEALVQGVNDMRYEFTMTHSRMASRIYIIYLQRLEIDTSNLENCLPRNSVRDCKYNIFQTRSIRTRYKLENLVSNWIQNDGSRIDVAERTESQQCNLV